MMKMEMKMTIKFSDETIKQAEVAGYNTPGWARSMDAVAAVFEAAANAQVMGNNTISGMTDDALANELWTAYGTESTVRSGWLAAARHARKLLQPNVKDSLTVQSEYQIRAERAESAIERVRELIETLLRHSSNSEHGR